MAYAYGEPVTLTLTDAAGATAALADYTDVVLTIVQPDATSVTLKKSDVTLTDNPHNFQPTQSGRHVYYYVTTTPNGATTPQPFEVETAGAAQIVSLGDVKTHLNIDPTDIGQDAELQTFINRATPIIESLAGPVIQRTVTAEQHTPTGNRLALIERPVVSVTSITEYIGKVAHTVTVVADPTATTTYSATLDGDKGVLTRWATATPRPWATPVYVTYVAGRESVPPSVTAATLELIREMWESQRGGGEGRAIPGSGPEEIAGTTSLDVLSLLGEEARLDGFA